MRNYLLPVIALALAACGGEGTAQTPEPAEGEVAEASAAMETAYETVGEVTIHDERGRDILSEDAVIEKLTGDEFRWSEGPVWIGGADGYVLFSDVPNNVIYKWSEAGGLETFMQPAGYDGPETEIFREPGTNGLIRAGDGQILAGDHGNRAITRIDLETKEKVFVVQSYDGMKLSSPNDLVFADDGSLYFTDPPYGLSGIDDSPAKETTFNGVYRLSSGALGGEAGVVEVVDDELTKPNGVILSPDGRTLYVAQSDPALAAVFAYDLGADGLPVGERRVFADLTAEFQQRMPGLPDGMAMDTQGNLYTTGPGGVRIYAPDGALLALISTGTAAANVTFGGGDGSTLYITSGSFLARVETNATGLGF